MGAGTGLLTLAALTRVGPHGSVTAVDQSGPALRSIRPAPGGGTLRRVVADAAKLPIPDSTAHAVVTRSVLIYLEDLARTIQEAARILKPGGRLSVFEPLNNRRHHDAELHGIADAEIQAVTAAAAQATPAARTMTAFDAHALISHAANAGFQVHPITTDTVTTTMYTPDAVDAHLNRRPHPGAPTPLETVITALGEPFARHYRQAWHDAVERKPITYTTPVLYLTATARTH
ncbi:class I SAM-dependent methyltransferase [Parafrankia sp. FMc2]|uniref:class I SAM-dependent methyltransferase n=1 Tax=Parafrankia sp. FMc2 TaxID=3233196 RepID=UPI003B587E48